MAAFGRVLPLTKAEAESRGFNLTEIKDGRLELKCRKIGGM